MPHGDGFTLHFPEQGILQDLMLALRQHAYTMRGLPVPSSWPLPAAPLITSAKAQSNGGVVLAWRGAAPAINYTVARSTSANGPWTVICQQCATDYDTPWTDSQAAAGTTYYYRVQGFNMDGTGGAWSPVVTAGI